MIEENKFQLLKEIPLKETYRIEHIEYCQRSKTWLYSLVSVDRSRGYNITTGRACVDMILSEKELLEKLVPNTDLFASFDSEDFNKQK